MQICGDGSRCVRIIADLYSKLQICADSRGLVVKMVADLRRWFQTVVALHK